MDFVHYAPAYIGVVLQLLFVLYVPSTYFVLFWYILWGWVWSSDLYNLHLLKLNNINYLHFNQFFFFLKQYLVDYIKSQYVVEQINMPHAWPCKWIELYRPFIINMFSEILYVKSRKNIFFVNHFTLQKVQTKIFQILLQYILYFDKKKNTLPINKYSHKLLDCRCK